MCKLCKLVGFTEDEADGLHRWSVSPIGGDSDGQNSEKVFDPLTLEGLAKYIKSDKCKNIVTMVGAGFSACKYCCQQV